MGLRDLLGLGSKKNEAGAAQPSSAPQPEKKNSALKVHQPCCGACGGQGHGRKEGEKDENA